MLYVHAVLLSLFNNVFNGRQHNTFKVVDFQIECALIYSKWIGGKTERTVNMLIILFIKIHKGFISLDFPSPF